VVLTESPLDDGPPQATREAAKTNLHSATLVRQADRFRLLCITLFCAEGDASYCTNLDHADRGICNSVKSLSLNSGFSPLD
jgi:hypothetical protein